MQISKPLEQRFWEKVDKNGPIQPHTPELGQCWQWIAAKDKFGYGVINDYNILTKKKKYKQAHILSAHFHNIKNSEYLIIKENCVLHKCDNPSCVNPQHLYIGDKGRNLQDAYDRGRKIKPKGELSGRAKLTEVQVLEIRNKFPTYTKTQLSKEYNVSLRNIRSIVLRESWTHI